MAAHGAIPIGALFAWSSVLIAIAQLRLVPLHDEAPRALTPAFVSGPPPAPDQPELEPAEPAPTDEPVSAEEAELPSGLRGVVVDREGRPVPGAWVVTTRSGRCTCQILRMLCGAEGRFDRSNATDMTVHAEESEGSRISTIHAVDLDAGERLFLPLELLEIRPGLQVDVQTDHPLARALAPDVEVWVGGRPLRDGDHDGDPLVAPVEVPFEVRVVHGALEGRAPAPAGSGSVAVPLEPFRHLEVQVQLSIEAQVQRGASRCRFDGVGVRFTPARRFARSDRAWIDLAEPLAATLDVPENLGGVLTLEWDDVTLRRVVRSDERVVRLTLPATGELAWGGDPRARLLTTVDGTRYAAPYRARAPAGPARVVVQLGGLAATALVDVRARRVTTVDLPLAPGATVRGRLVDPRGRPVPARVEVAGAPSGEAPSDGRFTCGPVPPGRWTLTASWPYQLRRVAARLGAERAWLPERTVEVTGANDVDLGDLVVQVE